MPINRTDKLRFDGLLDHVRAIVAGANMFDPKTQMKIDTKADKLWTELRAARKRQLLAQLQGETQGVRT